MYLSPSQKEMEMFYCTVCEDKKHFSVLVSVSMPVTCKTGPAIYTSQNRAGDIFIAFSRKINL
jgi:hypothetical protein